MVGISVFVQNICNVPSEKKELLWFVNQINFKNFSDDQIYQISPQTQAMKRKGQSGLGEPYTGDAFGVFRFLGA
jgi:hypothetical protein